MAKRNRGRSPHRMSRRGFIRTVGAGAVAGAAYMSGLERYRAFAAQQIPAHTFGRMFPDLPPFAQPTEEVVTALEQLGAPGGIMDAKDLLSAGPVALINDPDLSENNRDNPNTPAGATYFGQFVDHDLTFDQTSALGETTAPEQSPNTRTPRFDLDSVYLGGPEAASSKQVIDIQGRVVASGPQIYDPDDSAKLRVEFGGLFEDVPRDETGSAIIGDPRNDENLIIAGMHAAFLLFHNRVVDELRAGGTPEGEVFSTARRLTTWHYQWLVVHEFLPLFIGQALTDEILASGPRYLDETSLGMTVEFQGAAYRFGHSMVRPSYRANLQGDPQGNPDTGAPAFFGFIFDPSQVGEADPDDLIGGVRAPRRFIGWQSFFNFGDGVVRQNKRINNRVSTPLFDLPRFAIPAMEGPTSLMQRNLLRNLTWSLPSGQSIANEIGAPVLGPSDLSELAELGLQNSTPLFYYILREAGVMEDGLQLGPTGSRIVGETFVNSLLRDPNSYIVADPSWVPTVGGAGEGFRMTDFLTFAGVDPASRGQ